MVGDRKFAQFLRFEAVLTSEDIMALASTYRRMPKTKVTSRLQIKYYCFGEGDQEVAGISRMPFLKPNHLMSHRK